MTLEEFSAAEQKIERMDTVGDALEEVLSKARSQRTITVGVYEAAKLLNVDPDNVVLCLLAADEDDDRDVALQIHFTLIRAFCCENDINILRVSNPGRLAELLLLENDKSPAESGRCADPGLTLCAGDEPTFITMEGSCLKSTYLFLPGKSLHGSVGASD